MVALSALGLPQAIIVFIGKKNAKPEELLQIIYLFWLLLSIAIIIIFFILYFNGWYFTFNNHIIFLLTLLYIVKVLDYFQISFIRGHQNFFVFNIKKIIEPLLFLLTILAIQFIKHVGIESVLSMYLLISFISTLGISIYIHKKILFSFAPFGLNINLIKKITRFGFKSYIQIVTGHLNYQISIYMIAWFLSKKDVGIYAIAVSFASVLWFIPNTLGIVLLPALSSKKDDYEINKMTVLIARHTFYLVLIGIWVIAIAGKVLIPLLYGPVYNLAYLPMIFLLPGILAMTLFKVLTRNFTSRNLQHLTIYASLIALLASLLLNPILILSWGLVGGALASSLIYVGATIMLLHFFGKESSVPYRSFFILDKKDILIYSDLFKKLLIKIR